MNQNKSFIWFVLKIGFFIAWYTEISSVTNSINKWHISSGFHSGYIHNFYYDRQVFIDEIFCWYIKPLLEYIEHTILNQEWKKYIDDAAYEKIYKQINKATIQGEIN